MSNIWTSELDGFRVARLYGKAPEWLMEMVPADLEPDQPCDGSSDCTVSFCKAQDGGFIHDATFNGQDGEAECQCEHHELRDFSAVLS